MISGEIRPSFDATSAAGAMLMRQVREPILVGFMLASLGTSAAYALPTDGVVQCAADRTTAGTPVLVATQSGAAIGELRRLSGLTWDQLARLFNVSRRALHFWASGKAMAPSNEEHLQRLIAVLRKVDSGSASINRAMLLSVREDGSLPFDLLADGDYEGFLSLIRLSKIRRPSPPSLSEDTRAAREPRPPEELVGALQDRIHRTSGRLLGAKAVAVPRSK